MYQTIFESLGFIGLLIVFLLLLSLFFFIQRLSLINAISIDSANFVDGILNLLNSNKRIEAITLCEETQGPVSSMIRSTLLHNIKDINKIENSFNTVASLEISILNKRIEILKYLAICSTMLGLLGTLISIVENLDIVISSNVALNPMILLTFFTYAINTSILGVLVSIVIFFIFTYLQYRIKIIISDMEWSAHKIHHFFIYSD